ncbi:MAG: hypothetical protein H7Y09_06000 [Chitinophagaceae bacterium]|nr:hypothetical protein [Anaerolineae bacterium]
MKISRKLLLLTFVVGALALLSVAMVSTSSAQNGVFCVDVAELTDGDILVDVPGAFSDDLQQFQVQCNVLSGSVGRREAGTPVDNQATVEDYGSVAAVDVWTATRPGGADFDIYDPAVRVCFNADSYGVDATAAVGPVESATGAVGPALLFSDARVNFADRLSNAAYRGFSRAVTQLDIVAEGRDLGYVCGDINYPGTVNLSPGLPLDREDDSPYHPNYPNQPDRCFIPGASDCFD